MSKLLKSILARPDGYPDWPNEPELRRTVDWFKSFLTDQDWQRRMEAAARRLYSVAAGKFRDPSDLGRFFEEKDTFGWYLFLADAYLHHPWNYDPTFGARVVPVFSALGRKLDLILSIEGIAQRVQRIVGPERRQPNGGIFEILVGAAYRETGARVAFVPETPGLGKKHDLDVEREGQVWAVECKRLEHPEYEERERAEARRLWRLPASLLVQSKTSALLDVSFTVELSQVRDAYLAHHIERFLRDGRFSFKWRDQVSHGTIRPLDLKAYQDALKETAILTIGSRTYSLLTGEYVRNASYLAVLNHQPADNPRFTDKCDFAALLRWQSVSEEAVDKRARDVRKRLSDALAQIPSGTPAAIHIGFETVEGQIVEDRRYDKVRSTIAAFDYGGKDVRAVFVHYFIPESHPDGNWFFDETVVWWASSPDAALLNDYATLVIPPEVAANRPGVHWKEAPL
jgi:hypothetical protein